MPLSIFRTYALVLAVLSALSALVLDGVLLRYFWRPLANKLESRGDAPIRYPPGLHFMLTHAWARRAYNLAFAAIMLVIWWFLGTPAGAQLVHQR